MKKLFIIFIIIMLIPSSCKPKEEFGVILSDWGYAENVQDLVNKYDFILIGKITGISFQIIDTTNDQSPTEKSEEYNIQLYTVFDFNITAQYKGKVPRMIKVKAEGGKKDYRVDEQRSLLKKYSNKRITVDPDIQGIDIGKTYLLATSQDRAGKFGIWGAKQTVFDLHDPFYAPLQDKFNESMNISAKDIIMTFGKDKWDEFWTQWQKDNPKWETWLDKATVNKALAEDP